MINKLKPDVYEFFDNNFDIYCYKDWEMIIKDQYLININKDPTNIYLRKFKGIKNNIKYQNNYEWEDIIS